MLVIAEAITHTIRITHAHQHPSCWPAKPGLILGVGNNPSDPKLRYRVCLLNIIIIIICKSYRIITLRRVFLL